MIKVSRFDDLSPARLSSLQRALAAYYAKPPDSYYEIANQAADQYQADLMPFHCDLVRRIESNMRVFEMGCGSAHLCPKVEARGGHYSGIDHSEELLAWNRSRFPKANFHRIGDPVTEAFDVVASLYTIEHVTDPLSYLNSMWERCKPGGLLAVICPDFIDGEGFPPSFYYGKTPRRLREKLVSFALTDALSHLTDLYWFAPRWKRCARAADVGSFWINTHPSELEGAVHGVDTDAVHLPRMADIAHFFAERGATIEATSRTLPEVPADVLHHNSYVLARRP